MKVHLHIGVVRAADELSLKEALAVAALQHEVLALPAPNVAALEPAAARKLAAALRQHDLHPRVIEEAPRVTAGSAAPMGGFTAAAGSGGMPDCRALDLALIRVLLALRDLRPKPLKSGTLPRKALDSIEHHAGDGIPPGFSPPAAGVAFLAGLARAAGLLADREGKVELEDSACELLFAMSAGDRLAALRAAWVDAPAASNGNGTVFDRKRVCQSLIRAAEGVAGSAGGDAAAATSALTPASAIVDAAFARTPEALQEFVAASVALLGEGGAALAASKSARGRTALEPVASALLLPLIMLRWIEPVETAGKGEPSVTVPPASVEGITVQPGAKPFVIQANFDVVVLLPETSTEALWKLGTIASPKTFAQVAHFRLHERHVATAANAGTALDDVVAFLGEHSKTELPQNVRFSLSEWVRRTERVTIIPDAVLFEAEGIEHPEKLVDSGFARVAGLVPLTDRLLAGAAASAPNPKSAVAPRHPVFDYSRPIPAAVTSGADGTLACPHDALDFRTAQTLGKIAEPAGVDRWRVTRASIQGALGRGVNHEALLDALVALSRTTLPPLLRAQVLAWSGQARAAAVGEATLLTVPDVELVGLLSEAEETAAFFARPLNATTFLLDAGAADAARSALAAASIEVLSGPPREDEMLADVLPAQLARIQRAPAKPTGLADGERFAALWARSRGAALEYAAAHGATLAVSMKQPGGAPERLNLRVLAAVVMPGTVYVEAEQARGRDARLYDAAWILEADVL